MTKPQKHRLGITLVEVIIVLAISTLLILLAFGFLGNRDRRDFDNSMRQLVDEIRSLQNTANSGVAADPTTYNCLQVNSTYTASGSLQACPFAPYTYLGVAQPTFGFGIAVSFGHSAGSMSDSRYAGVTAGGKNLGRSYFTYTLGFKPLLSPNVFGIESTPVVHTLPGGIGFLGYCLNDTTCTNLTNSGGLDGGAQATTTVFSRANLTSDVTPSNNGVIGQFGAGALTRSFPNCVGGFAGTSCVPYAQIISASGCPTPSPGTIAGTIPNPSYFDMYNNANCSTFGNLLSQQSLTLRFTDTANANLNAKIIINPTDNSVNLVFQ